MPRKGAILSKKEKFPIYLTPEKKAILELKKIGKPFLILVNSEKPYGDDAARAVSYLENTYVTKL